MADLAQLDLGTRGGEVRLRAFLEDFVDYYFHTQVSAYDQLALVVWFAKVPHRPLQMLALFRLPPMDRIAPLEKEVPLLWKVGSAGPPFVDVFSTSVDFFSRQWRADARSVSMYSENCEVLYFKKQFLSSELLSLFKIVTEPSGLMKGWYVSREEYDAKSGSVRALLASRASVRPEVGLVKIWESDDFENCRGLLHIEIEQRWLPISPEGLKAYTYYNDAQNKNQGLFLFEGGSLYQILKFEIKSAPEYFDKGTVLEKTRDDRYPEVYLRAVHPSDKPAS